VEPSAKFFYVTLAVCSGQGEGCAPQALALAGSYDLRVVAWSIAIAAVWDSEHHLGVSFSNLLVGGVFALIEGVPLSVST
jgi:hypothetical protein